MIRFATPKRRPLVAYLALALAGSTCHLTWANEPTASMRGLVGATTGSSLDRPVDRTPPRRRDIPARPATTWVVTNCNDQGPGSLRDAVAGAGDADVVDLSQLTCSTITLTTDTIAIDGSPYLKGPGADALTIDGNHQFAVLRHFGQGTLVVSRLTLANGYYVTGNTPFGGAIYSSGSVAVQDSVVRDSTAIGTSSTAALGGGIYTHGDLTLVRSTVSGNHVQSISGAYAKGGGAYAKGLLESNASTFSNNSATSTATSGAAGAGGGAFVLGQVILYASTINANQAQTVGGLVIGGAGANSPSVVTDSTVSGNTSSASSYGGGIYVAAALSLSSSTITGNVESHVVDTVKYGAGLSLGEYATVDIESSIVYGNHFDENGGELADDIGGHTTTPLSGANNIVEASVLALPPDTFSHDPQLMPLGDYGGPTLTHALPFSSPAIDAGNRARFAADDQRGSGYPRISGAQPDIGAYEFQFPSDLIFEDGFE